MNQFYKHYLAVYKYFFQLIIFQNYCYLYFNSTFQGSRIFVFVLITIGILLMLIENFIVIYFQRN